MSVWKFIFLLCPVTRVTCKCIQHMQKARDILLQRNKNVNNRDPPVIFTFCSPVLNINEYIVWGHRLVLNVSKESAALLMVCTLHCSFFLLIPTLSWTRLYFSTNCAPPCRKSFQSRKQVAFTVQHRTKAEPPSHRP